MGRETDFGYKPQVGLGLISDFAFLFSVVVDVILSLQRTCLSLFSRMSVSLILLWADTHITNTMALTHDFRARNDLTSMICCETVVLMYAYVGQRMSTLSHWALMYVTASDEMRTA